MHKHMQSFIDSIFLFYKPYAMHKHMQSFIH